jgi:hypothetical protein
MKKIITNKTKYEDLFKYNNHWVVLGLRGEILFRFCDSFYINFDHNIQRLKIEDSESRENIAVFNLNNISGIIFVENEEI